MHIVTTGRRNGCSVTGAVRRPWWSLGVELGKLNTDVIRILYGNPQWLPRCPQMKRWRAKKRHW